MAKPQTVDHPTPIGYRVDMSTNTHTYTVVRSNYFDWTGNPDDVFSVECNCGVASGVSHATVEGAHRECQHTTKVNSNRHIGPPLWDGRVIDGMGFPK